MEYAKLKKEYAEQYSGKFAQVPFGDMNGIRDVAIAKGKAYPMWQPEGLDDEDFDTVILLDGIPYRVQGRHFLHFTEEKLRQESEFERLMSGLVPLFDEMECEAADYAKRPELHGEAVIAVIADVLMRYDFTVVDTQWWMQAVKERRLLEKYHREVERFIRYQNSEIDQVRDEVEKHFKQQEAQNE